MDQIDENRRAFLTRAAVGALSIPLLLSCGNNSLVKANENDLLALIKRNAITDPDCNWCGARDVPNDVTWKTTLANQSDEGDPILISGTVLEADGKTPAPNILIYFYHTDIKGLYGRNGQPRHGRYRGWMLTNKKGGYEFHTIKPASYPNTWNPAHIHMTVTGERHKENWIDTILFEGDKFITHRQRTIRKGGFNPILDLKRNRRGIFRGVRNIQLQKV